MKKWILATVVILSSIPALSQTRPPRYPGPETPERAPRIEVRDVIRAVGYDRRDCEYNVQRQASSKERELLQSCERQSQGRCMITSRRHMGGGYIHPIVGTYKVDDYKIDASTCRSRAASLAEREALSNCRTEYGVSCQITRRGVADHREEVRRRYVIAGPKERFQVCRGDAQAAPESRYREMCSLEITASNY